MAVLPRSPRLGAVLLLAMLFAACDAAAPTPTAAPTDAAPGPASTPSAGASSTASLAPDHLSDVHAYPELEERLPSHVGPYELTKVSLSFSADRQDPKTLELLRRLGHTPADLQLALATGGEAVQVSAFRIVGADAVKIISTLQQVEEESANNRATFGGATIGGKRLLTRTTENQLTYLYPAEDIMFVLSGDEALVEEALGQLP